MSCFRLSEQLTSVQIEYALMGFYAGNCEGRVCQTKQVSLHIVKQHWHTNVTYAGVGQDAANGKVSEQN